MADNLTIELHQAKDIITWIKEIRDYLPFVKMNESARMYISIRVNDAIEKLKEARLDEQYSAR